MKIIKWQEDGVWNFMATDNTQMLKYMVELVGNFEYVEGVS